MALQEPFYNISQTLPDKIALTFYENEDSFMNFTYADLHQQCLKIVDFLVLNSKEHGTHFTIGICCDSGPSAIACMFGVLTQTSFTYISPEITELELNSFLETVPITTLIIEKRYLDKFHLLSLKFDFTEVKIFEESFQLINIKSFTTKKNLSEDSQYPLAYIMCTSGSTGTPKFVYVPHLCIVPNIRDFQRIFNVSKADVILNLSPLTFDPSIIDIFLSLSYGAHLIILLPNLIRRTKCLEAILKKNPISIMQSTPSLLGTLSHSFLNHYFSSLSKSLRIVALGGESFPSKVKCRKWFSPNCKMKIYNLYGLTEISCWSSVQEVNIAEYMSDATLEEPASISLGSPLTGTTLHLVDNLGNRVSKGEGNIIISGERNICSILDKKKDKRTIHQTIQSGDVGYTDGNSIFYVGRFDNIIKRNAHKISLLEIDTVCKLLEIDECCTISHQNEIHTFVSFPKTSSITKGLLEIHLKKHLSEWKLPNKIHIIENLPLNKNSKIDRQKLVLEIEPKKYFNVFSSIGSSKSKISVPTMKKLWKEILEGIIPKENDNFIMLGGNSIQAIQLSEEIQKVFSQDNSLLLERLLNNTFEDVCNLVNNFEELTSPENYINRDSERKPKRRKKEKLKVDCSSTKSISGKKIYSINRKGCFYNGEKCLHVPATKMKTLNLCWKVSLDKCIDSSPLIVQMNGEIRIFIGSHSHLFVCLASSGQEIWRVKLPDRIEASACLSHDGKAVYIGCYDGYLYSLNTDNGEEMWKVETGATIKSTAVVDSKTGYLVFGSYDRHLYCCDSFGQIIWKKQLTKGSIFSSPAINDDLVYLGTLDGYIVCVNMYKGDIQWKKLIGKPIFSSVTICSFGLVFGCTDGLVYGLNFKSEILWTYKSEGPIFSSPFVVEYGHLLLIAIGSHDHNLHLIDGLGTVISSIPFSSPIYSTPYIAVNKDESFSVIITETNGYTHVYEWILNDKELKPSLQLEYKLKGEGFSSPIFYEDKVYVGCRDNNLYCLST